MPNGKCPKSLLSRSGKARGTGQTTVEFALICLPFFVILFAIVDYAQIYFYENSMQNALREACRFATAGRVIDKIPLTYTNIDGVTVPVAITGDSTYGGGNMEASRNECIRYWFQSNCAFYIPPSNITIVSAPTLSGIPPTVTTNELGKLTLVQTNGATANYGPGNANDYIQIRATYTINTITPLFSYLGGYSRQGVTSATAYPIYVSAIVKNEPALLNFKHTAAYTNLAPSGPTPGHTNEPGYY